MKQLFFLCLFTALLAAACRPPSQRTADAASEERNFKGIAETPSATASDSTTADVAASVITGNTKEQLLHRTGYTASYNAARRVPNWVAWTLTSERTVGAHKRQGRQFSEDTEVPAPRATSRDYTRTGYDRGHLCPSGDNQWNGQAQTESFLMTNICPQNHLLNMGDWNEMEIKCRKWARRYGTVYIVAGPIFLKGRNKTIGANAVAVPDAFFKVVLRLGNAPKAIGFIYRNEKGSRPWGDYVNTVDDVERITGYDFFTALPDELENSVERTADRRDWPE